MLVRNLACALCVGSLLLTAGCSLFESDRQDVLVIVLSEDASSVAMGERYAAAHRIPDHRILRLPPSVGAGRLEIDWPAFQTQIAEPLEAYLALEDPENEIEILVTTRGLPLRIGRCEPASENGPSDSREQAGRGMPRGCRAATVDAALASLGRIDPEKPGVRRAVNPFFRDRRSFSEFRRAQPQAPLRFLVARLVDPATPAATTPPPSEIDSPAPPLWRIATRPRALHRSPATRSLLSPIAEQLPRRGSRICDDCDLPASAAVGRAGAADGAGGEAVTRAGDPVGGIVYVDLEESEPLRRTLARRRVALAAPGLVIDLTSRLSSSASEARGAPDLRASFDAPDAPVDATDAPDASDAARHLASVSGSLRFDQAVADWIAVGARAISTHLDDPGLAGVTRPAVQIDGLLAGRSAVESHYRSVPLLGWMNVFLGDPLLRWPIRSLPAPPDLEDDLDGDGIADEEDNCVAHPNPAQRDSDGDGYGNRCDADVDNDGLVDSSWGQIYPMDARGDLEAIALTIRGGRFDPDHDLDGDGRVDETDLALAQLWLFRAPGPSGRGGRRGRVD